MRISDWSSDVCSSDLISAIDREMLTVVPGAGRMVSFVTSPFGLIWIGTGVFMFFIYPVMERKKERHEVETVETKAQLQHVVAAVADYGHHLKSHTEILIAMSQAAQDLSAVVTRLDGRIEPGAAILSPAASTGRLAAQIIELPVVAGADEAPAKIEVAVVDAPADLVETVEVTEIVDAVETPVAEPATEVAAVEAAPKRSEEHKSE